MAGKHREGKIKKYKSVYALQNYKQTMSLYINRMPSTLTAFNIQKLSFVDCCKNYLKNLRKSTEKKHPRQSSFLGKAVG